MHRRSNPFSSPLVQSLPPFSECFSNAPTAVGQRAPVDIEVEALLHPMTFPAALPAHSHLDSTAASEEGPAATASASEASSLAAAWWEGPAPSALRTPPGREGRRGGERGEVEGEEEGEEEEEECLADRLGALWLASSPPHSPSMGSTGPGWSAASRGSPTLNLLSPIPQFPTSPPLSAARADGSAAAAAAEAAAAAAAAARRLTYGAPAVLPGHAPGMLLAGEPLAPSPAAMPSYLHIRDPIARAEFRRWAACSDGSPGKAAGARLDAGAPLGGTPGGAPYSPVNAAHDAYAASWLASLGQARLP